MGRLKEHKNFVYGTYSIPFYEVNSHEIRHCVISGFRREVDENYLYLVDRASCHKFLLITNLMYFFMYLFIHFISLHLSSIKCSSSGDRIVLIHHLVWLVCVSDCLVCRSGIPSSHLHRLITPDDVLIQFDLLMMSIWCSKDVERWNE